MQTPTAMHQRAASAQPNDAGFVSTRIRDRLKAEKLRLVAAARLTRHRIVATVAVGGIVLDQVPKTGELVRCARVGGASNRDVFTPPKLVEIFRWCCSIRQDVGRCEVNRFEVVDGLVAPNADCEAAVLRAVAAPPQANRQVAVAVTGQRRGIGRPSWHSRFGFALAMRPIRRRCGSGSIARCQAAQTHCRDLRSTRTRRH